MDTHETNQPASAASHHLQYAGFGRRALAFLIDGIAVGALAWFAAALILPGAGPDVAGYISGTVAAQQSVIDFVVALVYFAEFESSHSGATLGKRLLGIRVTDLQGRRIRLGHAATRNVFRVLSTICLLVGYSMALFTQKKQTLHDILAKTVVIKV